MKGLSILIPEYNCDCTQLVRDLHRQCASAQLPSWEIVVADDGSIDETAVNQNRIIATWDNCTFIRNEQNMGRAAIRNFLAEKAQYDRLIFIDSDMCIVCVVGDLDWSNVGFETIATDALKDIPVRMISYGGSNYNISFLIRESDKKRALQSLSDTLFNK